MSQLSMGWGIETTARFKELEAHNRQLEQRVHVLERALLELSEITRAAKPAGSTVDAVTIRSGDRGAAGLQKRTRSPRGAP